MLCFGGIPNENDQNISQMKEKKISFSIFTIWQDLMKFRIKSLCQPELIQFPKLINQSSEYPEWKAGIVIVYFLNERFVVENIPFAQTDFTTPKLLVVQQFGESVNSGVGDCKVIH